MIEFKEGDIAICSTCQAGTVIQISGQDAWVLLRSGEIWTGLIREIRIPQDQADLDACPITVERMESKRIARLDK